METNGSRPGVAVLARVDARTLSGLHVAEGFTACGGDTDKIAELLENASGDPEGLVAIGVGERARIVGFLCARAPGPESPLYSVAAALELAAFEVARPAQGRGVFTGMFRALFRRTLEEHVLYVVADPELKQKGEPARAFRDRLAAVLGPLGFVPLPTDDPALHPHRDSVLLVRVGRGVPGPDVEDFFERLRSPMQASVAVALRASALRNLVRRDLERNGFHVHSVSVARAPAEADIVITDGDEYSGRTLTVRVDGGEEMQLRDATLWYPAAKLDRLPTILREELNRRRGAHV